MKMNMLFVCGTFDSSGGKRSSIGKRIATSLEVDKFINGGNLKTLSKIDFSLYKYIIWMPNIDNLEDKLLPDIKKKNPHAVLISSKRVVEKEYTEWDVVGRLLASRSNLGIMITYKNERYVFSLLDPLGNSYYKGDSAVELSIAIARRLKELENMTRCSSRTIGPVQNKLMNEDFMQVVRNTADEFSKYVNANNPHRMLGNASTRCMQGFPAVRFEDTIFVTRRNIDKQTIAADGFIETRLVNDPLAVEYWGDVKPSVDTPIQLMLFEYYDEIKYMIHGHVYIEGAPFTKHKIPCGYIEEFYDVVNTVMESYQRKDNFAVNLLGHGCLVAASNLSYFDNIKYTNRPLPEGI